MMRGMYAAISGLESHQTMLDVTANNLANVDTIGYKGQRTTFVDQLTQTLRSASGTTGSSGGTNPVQVGLGVSLGSIDNMMSQGSAQGTGNPLDVAIQGAGFFEVGNGSPTAPTTADPTAAQKGVPAQSTLQYSRAGNFTIDNSGFLTNQSGQYVIGQTAAGSNANGGSVTQTYLYVPPGSTNVAIGQDGAVTYTDTGGNTQTAGYLSVANFANDPGMARDGGSLWSSTVASGINPMIIGSPGSGGLGSTISGELEMSNVDLATEFTNMITAQSGYQANSRVITTAAQMLQTAVQMGQ